MTIFVADEQTEPVDLEAARALATHVLQEEGVPADSELAVVFVDVDQMTQYNGRFMERTGPTDVLAFPLDEHVPGTVPRPQPAGPPLGLGDVFICPTVVRANAIAAEIDVEDEMALMVVHGILHLLGYDHGDAAAAEQMESRERDLLAAVGRQRP